MATPSKIETPRMECNKVEIPHGVWGEDEVAVHLMKLFIEAAVFPIGSANREYLIELFKAAWWAGKED